MFIYDIPPSLLSLNSNLEFCETAIGLSFRPAVDTLLGPKILQFYFRVLVPPFPDLRWHVRTQLVSRSLTPFPFFCPSLKIISIIFLPPLHRHYMLPGIFSRTRLIRILRILAEIRHKLDQQLMTFQSQAAARSEFKSLMQGDKQGLRKKVFRGESDR